MGYWKAVSAVLLVLVACNGAVQSDEELLREDALKAGDIDTGFGSAGKASTVFGSQTPDPATNYLERSQVEILRITGNRRIVSLGSNSRDGWALMTRHSQSGNLDTTFAQEGKLRVAAGLKPVGLEFYCPASKSQDCDNPTRIVVAGTQTQGNADRVWLGVFSDKGVPEAGFGQSGVVTSTVFELAQAQQLAVQSDGKILLLASASRVGYSAQVLLRFLPDGKLDESFGNKGILTVSDDNTDPVIRHMLQLPGGQILLLGPSFAQKGWLYSIRYKADGTPDLTYGQNAVASVFVGEILDGLRQAIWVEGSVIYWGPSGMLQLSSSGALVPSFGDKGMVRFGGTAQVKQVIALPSGYLYTLAAPPDHQVTTEIFLTRYYSDGVLDDAYGNTGTKNLTLIGEATLGVFFEPVVATIARYGNRVIVGGRTVDYSSSDQRAIFTLTRLR